MEKGRDRAASIGQAVKTVKPNLVSASAIMPSLVVRLSSDQEKKKEPVARPRPSCFSAAHETRTQCRGARGARTTETPRERRLV